jgi:hypothetical protein
MELRERFEAVNHDYLEFARVENKRNQRPDLHAFLLLDELCPKEGRDMIRGAEHDEFYLDVNDEQLEALSDDQILELVRCGVMVNSDGYLYMFT